MPADSPATPNCRACGSSRVARFFAREMMFGLRDRFAYLECSACGCLQIECVPADLSKYYPADYYPYARRTPAPPGLTRYLRRKRSLHLHGRHSAIGALLVARFGAPLWSQWFEGYAIGYGDAILDIGCGSGELLLQMSDAGFTCLAGADPYIPEDLEYSCGVVVRQAEIDQIEGQYDVVMLHHSLEHMPDHAAALARVRDLLTGDGVALVRMPVAGSYAWRAYGADWVQLDAPRHLMVHSESSFRMMTASAGLKLERVRYDSTGAQFWASEQYKMDIPLRDARSHLVNPAGSKFSAKQIGEYESQANALNQAGDGDQACFYLRRT